MRWCRENNEEERRKQQEELRRKERDQYYSNKVYLSPLANAEGTYTEASENPFFHESKAVIYGNSRRVRLDDDTDYDSGAALPLHRTILVER